MLYVPWVNRDKGMQGVRAPCVGFQQWGLFYNNRHSVHKSCHFHPQKKQSNIEDGGRLWCFQATKIFCLIKSKLCLIISFYSHTRLCDTWQTTQRACCALTPVLHQKWLETTVKTVKTHIFRMNLSTLRSHIHFWNSTLKIEVLHFQSHHPAPCTRDGMI